MSARRIAKWGRAFAAAALASVAMLPAQADPVGTVTAATWSGDSLHLTVHVDGVPLGLQSSELGSTVTISGLTVPGTVSVDSASAQALTKAQTVMLVIDASGSMTGTKEQDTVAAADTFLTRTPASVPIGLIEFSDRPRLLTLPTLDRTLLRSLISGIRPSGDTSLYDATALALQQMPTSEACTVLVLTDGQDTRSRLSLKGASAALTASTCVTSFVGLQLTPKAFAILTQLAAAGHGASYEARDAASIASTFQQSLQSTSVTLIVDAVFPSTTPRDGAAQIALNVAGKTTGMTAALTAPEAKRAPVAPAALLGAAVVSGVALWLFLWLVTEGSDRARRRRIEAMIDAYALRRVIVSTEPERGDTFLETLEDLVHPFLQRKGRRERMVLQLEGAALTMSPEQWVLIRVAGSLFGIVLLLLAQNSLFLGLLLGVPAGYSVPQAWLSFRRRRRSQEFEAALPEALTLMASSLRSGFSLDQAIVAASQQGDDPMSIELRRAVQEIRIGSPLEGALERIAARMQSEDFAWVVNALRIQRRSGGNLAELLTTVSHTVRQRAQLAREVQALTAEGRLSAYVLIGLPVGLLVFLLLTQPDYLRPLYETSIGIAISFIALLMLAVGWLLMQRIIKVDV